MKPSTYQDNLALLRAFRDGDRAAGEQLVTQNTPLVYHVAERFTGRGVDREELVACGTVGLVKAMQSFDLSRGVMFSTYAVPLILGEIRRFLRDDGMIKVSREEKRLCARLNAERERRCTLGENTDIESLAAAVGVSREDAACALFAMSPVRSLDEPAFEEDTPLTLGHTLYDEEEERRTLDHLALRTAIDELPELQRKLIVLRYFHDMSQASVARTLGITQVKVSREEKKILATLRDKMSE